MAKIVAKKLLTPVPCRKIVINKDGAEIVTPVEFYKDNVLVHMFEKCLKLDPVPYLVEIDKAWTFTLSILKNVVLQAQFYPTLEIQNSEIKILHFSGPIVKVRVKFTATYYGVDYTPINLDPYDVSIVFEDIHYWEKELYSQIPKIEEDVTRKFSTLIRAVDPKFNM